MSGPGERETEEAGVTTSQTDLGPREGCWTCCIICIIRILERDSVIKGLLYFDFLISNLVL